MKKQKILDFIKDKKQTITIGKDATLRDADVVLVDNLMKFINEQQEYKGII